MSNAWGIGWGWAALIVALAVLSTWAYLARGEGSRISPLYPVKAPTSTVGALPACSASVKGVIFIATDVLLPVALAAASGGGGSNVLVVCNGSQWIIS